ncbi:hypothetical protein, partial [Salmonella enterica]|uniref:hypothetical protein n=1 Tax=Salmonella enterica TaxID=28901 RepID=UPI002A751C1A
PPLAAAYRAMPPGSETASRIALIIAEPLVYSLWLVNMPPLAAAYRAMPPGSETASRIALIIAEPLVYSL